MNYYDKLYQKIALPDSAVGCCEEIIPLFDKTADFASAAEAFVGGSCDIAPLLDGITGSSSLGRDALDLAFCVYASRFTHDIYAGRGISDDIFYDSMKDITVWNRQCEKDYSHSGIHGQLPWLSGTLQARLFRLGHFQFEQIKFGHDLYEKDGRVIRRGETVLNMHIPEDGPLYDELRYDSYRRGAEFWKNPVITCESWLLYPRHREFLRPDSRVLRFMDDFDIFDWGESADNGDMWRVFGVRESYEPSDLPRDSGMQRAYADWLGRNFLTGWGAGVRFEG